MTMQKNIPLDPLRIENLNKLEHMSAFPENWDNSGGQAFSASALRVFRGILEHACVQPHIAPTGRGSLLLQYEREDRSVLAFEVKEFRAEMVYVPMGDYAAVAVQTLTGDLMPQINFYTAQFYTAQ